MRQSGTQAQGIKPMWKAEKPESSRAYFLIP
jgi:hypothetical protein